MYTNTAAITIFEKKVGADRLPVYIPHVCGASYWENQTGQTQREIVSSEQDLIYCAIPSCSLTGYIPKRDDLICNGTAEEQNEECFTVKTVTNCLYGSSAVQHIEVTAV